MGAAELVRWHLIFILFLLPRCCTQMPVDCAVASVEAPAVDCALAGVVVFLYKNVCLNILANSPFNSYRLLLGLIENVRI